MSSSSNNSNTGNGIIRARDRRRSRSNTRPRSSSFSSSSLPFENCQDTVSSPSSSPTTSKSSSRRRRSSRSVSSTGSSSRFSVLPSFDNDDGIMGGFNQEQQQRYQHLNLYVGALEQCIETWKVVQQIPNYEEVVGELLFRQIFKIAPDAISLYSFGEAFGGNGDLINIPEDVFHLDAFKMHARGVVSMLEKVLVMMLSNQYDDLAISLQELGGRHVTYNVHPAHYSVVEAALLRVLDGALGQGDHHNPQLWNDDVRKSWAAVFKFVSKGMMNGAGSRLEITKTCRRLAEIDKSATLRLRVMPRSEGTSKLLLHRLRRTKSTSNMLPTAQTSSSSSRRRRKKSPSPKGNENSKIDGTYWSPDGRNYGDNNRGDRIDRSSMTRKSGSRRNGRICTKEKSIVDPDYETQFLLHSMGEGRFAAECCSGQYHFRDSLRSVRSLPVIPFDSEIPIEGTIDLDLLHQDRSNDDDDGSIMSNESLVSSNSNDSIPKLPTRSSERGEDEEGTVTAGAAVAATTTAAEAAPTNEEEASSSCRTSLTATSITMGSSSHSTSSSASNVSTSTSNTGPPKLPSRRRGSFEVEQEDGPIALAYLDHNILPKSNNTCWMPLNS